MATFELWPPGNGKKFSSTGLLLEKAPEASSYFTPRLTLNVEDSETVALVGQPQPKLTVSSSPPGIVSIERISEPLPNTTVYRITGLSKGTIQVEARNPGAPARIQGLSTSLASLTVVVEEKSLAEEDADFLSGFREGISNSTDDSAALLLNKISQDSDGFLLAVHMGCAKGLLEGLISLVQLLATILKIAINVSPIGIVVNTGRYLFDQNFRDEISKHIQEATKVALALADLIGKLTNPIEQAMLMRTFRIHGRVIGKIVGEEVGQEIKTKISQQSAKEIGEWVGFIIGRVMFEVIFIVATEGIGMAAGAAKATGEGAGIAARLAPKLRGLLRPLTVLTDFFKARIGARAGARAVEDGAKLAEVVREVTLRPRATSQQLRAMLANNSEYFSWRTPHPNVAKNEAIVFVGETNPNAISNVHLARGVKGLPYGDFGVVIKGSEFRIKPHPFRAEEFLLEGEIPSNAGFWFTQDELEAAKKL